jgi:hypothetical protein
MGRTESSDLSGLRASLGWHGFFIESEMALFSECMLPCAQKLLDTADIVREAILRQLRFDQALRGGSGLSPHIKM